MRPCDRGIVFDIQHNSYVDGPGLRTTVFFKGCTLRCGWCHNPESWEKKPILLHYADKCVSCGACAAVCMAGAVSPDGRTDRTSCAVCGQCEWVCMEDARALCGKEMTAEEVVRDVARDRIYYGEDGGITLSGGECLMQSDFAAEILRRCREAGIRTAVDTAGHVPREAFEAVLPYADLFLYDLKCADPALHRKGTGAENGRILDNLRFLLTVCPEKVAIRIPVIPGFNTDPVEIAAMASLLREMPHPPLWVEPLPYHAMGENKARAAGMEPVMWAVPSDAVMDAVRTAFAEWERA